MKKLIYKSGLVGLLCVTSNLNLVSNPPPSILSYSILDNFTVFCIYYYCLLWRFFIFATQSGPWNSHIIIAWELVRNAEPPCPQQTPLSQNLLIKVV